MLELWNVLNIKEYCEKLRSKKLGKLVFLTLRLSQKSFGNIFGTFYFRTKTSTSSAPSPPVANIFRKIFLRRGCSPEGRGPPSTNQIFLSTSVVLLLNIKLEYMRSEL
jgi:hypothetical protein